VNTLLCPHCQTPVSDSAKVCRGCGAEIVRGASRRERALIGAMFVVGAILVAAVVLRALGIAHGAPPLPPPKAEDGFLVLVGLFAVIVVPYLVGTRVARLLWRSRIRFYRAFQHQ
jgi:predicted nucleic acid-binding Zn ribbon protein